MTPRTSSRPPKNLFFETMRIVALPFIALPPLLMAQDSATVQLARAENEFARSAAEIGIKRAFLGHFGDSAIIFIPHAANAKQVFASEPENGDRLVWHPSFVEASSSADFGYTTGPSEYMPSGAGEGKARSAHFLSVWKKDGDGEWKVILDVGSRCPSVNMEGESLQVSKREIEEEMPATTPANRVELLLKADSLYSRAIDVEGSSEALTRFGSERVIVYRQGRYPARDRKNGVLQLAPEKFDGHTRNAFGVAASADLGFTHGLATTGGADTSTYVRIWRWENEWRVAVDLVNPWPKAGN